MSSYVKYLKEELNTDIRWDKKNKMFKIYIYIYGYSERLIIWKMK
ncbi:hypothetical protein CNEO3_200053 [Clostridium neonatale]|nr:hypothetical protein CNEO3_170061 [Clostridium neonatale]CAI3585016.1 hypothetical protein CNEO3_10079 [Clostridium neonatale]CAI3614496.1 hypothetical protein CNEO3_200053 [Clostridium neonatale]CAI3632106.1 hypothetical protein CNEO3_20002 [Clostridium neonatale]CAI3684267.1 hypothetical protein CNEO3_90052 [Clostridium neonatale]